MYIVENKRGYIKKPTFIFDYECQFIKEAYKFTEKGLKKFFMFRDKKRYKIYKIGSK